MAKDGYGVSKSDLISDDQKAVSQFGIYQAGSNILEWMKEITKNKAAPSFLLERFSTSSNTELKLAIADHSNTPLAVLELLAGDENPDIRFAVAENHNITKSILQVLAEDANPYIAFRANKTLNRISEDNQR